MLFLVNVSVLFLVNVSVLFLVRWLCREDREASVAAADKSRSINVLRFYVSSRQQERFKLTPLATSRQSG